MTLIIQNIPTTTMSGRYRQLFCVFCRVSFSQHRSLRRHIAYFHTCALCSESCILQGHQCQPVIVGRGNADFDPSPWLRMDNALENVLQTFQISISETIVSIENLFRIYKDRIVTLLTHCLAAYRNIKFSVTLTIEMQEIFIGRQEVKYFKSGLHDLLNILSSNVLIISSMNQIIRQVNLFVELGSSWSVKDIKLMDIDIAQYRPLRGGANIALPLPLRRRNGIANIPIRENCFRFCIYATYLGLSTKVEIERRSNYTQIFFTNRNNELINFSRIPILASLREIYMFERDNPTFSVNVFGFQEGEVYPLKIVKDRKHYHSDLLKFTDEESQESHYLLIFNFSVFMARNGHSRYYCYNCLKDFATETKRDEHFELCKEGKCRNLKFYNEGEGETVRLSEYGLPRALVLLYDFETFSKAAGGNANKVLDACHFTYLLASSEGEMLDWGAYTGRNVASIFVSKMDEIAARWMPKLQTYKNVVVPTAAGLQRCQSETCCICLQLIEGEMHKHHNHTEFHIRGTDGTLVKGGDYFGASHAECNKALRVQTHLPCLSHNYSRFDSLQMIRGLANTPFTKPSIVAKNSNQFLTIKYNMVQFMDTYLQLPFSLKDLVRILRASGIDKFKITKHMFREYEDQLDNLLLKQFFPYDYVTWENLDEVATTLPPIEAFYNSLRDESLSLTDYQHACYMYTLFNCNSIADYMRIYCLLDVCLLADVFMNHRKQCLDTFKIECLNFISCPSMSFRLVLGMSGQTLSYISDPNIYLLCKKGKRGGIVNYTDRLVYANYPNTESFDITRPVKSLIQLDFSAMYGKAMMQMLPVSSYRVLTVEEMARFNPMAVDDHASKGYLICGDFDISLDFHDHFKDLPPFPEKIEIDPAQASSFQRDYTDDFGESHIKDFKTEQLITSLYNKSKYVLHNFLLKLYLQLGGITIRQIHHVVEYTQAPFMKDFVEMAIRNRNSTSDESLRNYWKLIVNSSYGFTGLNVEEFCEIKIAKTAPRALQIISQPNFKGFTVLAPSLALLESSPIKTLIRNHLLVSTAILDYSKLLLYKTWYLGINQYFGSQNIQHKLLYCDTDSFMFSCNLEYESLLDHLSKIKVDARPIMDFSYLPNTHRLYSQTLENMPGFLKSETKYQKIEAFVCLKKKFYSLKVQGADDKMRAKGLPKHILHKNFSFETYKQAILTGEIQRTRLKLFKRLNQQIVEIQMNKMAFNSFSISRYLIPPRGIKTLPWGHCSILEGSVEVVTND